MVLPCVPRVRSGGPNVFAFQASLWFMLGSAEGAACVPGLYLTWSACWQSPASSDPPPAHRAGTLLSPPIIRRVTSPMGLYCISLPPIGQYSVTHSVRADRQHDTSLIPLPWRFNPSLGPANHSLLSPEEAVCGSSGSVYGDLAVALSSASHLLGIVLSSSILSPHIGPAVIADIHPGATSRQVAVYSPPLLYIQVFYSVCWTDIIYRLVIPGICVLSLVPVGPDSGFDNTLSSAPYTRVTRLSGFSLSLFSCVHPKDMVISEFRGTNQDPASP